MSKVWFSVVLGAVALLGLPGTSSAQHMRGGMPGNMHGGGFHHSGFHRFDRRFIDPRFSPSFIDPRFSSPFIVPRFNSPFIVPQFPTPFFDPRFGGL